MKNALLLLLAVTATLSAQRVYQCHFTPEEMTDWKLPPIAKIVKDGDANVLQVTVGEKKNDDFGRAILPFDFTKYAGKRLRISAEFQYENVTQPADKWNGTKFMMIFKTKDGQTHWMHPDGSWGTSDWKHTVYESNIPEDVMPGTIEFGLQDSTGTVRFKDFIVTLLDPVVIFPRLSPKDYQCPYTQRVKDEPIRRGVMSTGSFSPAVITSHLPDLQKMGANLYRWQLIRNWGATNDNQDIDEYINWVRGKIDGTKQVLDKAQELGIKVVLDLHVAPGGRRNGGYMNMFEQEKFANAFIRSWEILATAVKGHPALFGYDLINEPSQPTDIVYCDYLTLQYRVAQVVRKIDPDTPIIIESKDWDSPAAFKVMSPLPMKDVIYQAHMYFPFQFTHQGVGNNPKGGDLFYPNPDKGFTKEALKKHLQPVRSFQLQHQARIYIGEFSAIRWAQGADLFLADCISIFEEYGWDWSYHAFREWDGWSFEHSENPDDHAVSPVTTKRKEALLKGFSYNK